MTIHEIITALMITAAISYFIGRYDESKSDYETPIFVAIIGCLGVLSLVVAITLRVTKVI